MKLSANILMTFSTRLIVAVFALISSIFLARFLGPEGRGLLALVQLLPELAVTFAMLGFDQAYAVYAGLEPAKRRSMLWQSATTAIAAGGITAIAGAGFIILGAPGFEAMARGPLWLYMLPLAIVPVKMINDNWLAILRGMNRILLINAIELGSKIAAVFLIVILVGGLNLSVPGAVWTDVGINIGTVILLILIFRVMKVWGKPSFDWLLWKRAGRFALPVYFGTIMSYFNYRIDQLLVAILLPPEQLAFYVLAVGLAEQLWILTGAVSTALLPYLTNSKERDPALSAIIARHVMIWTGIACSMLFVLAQLLVQIMYSNAFVEAVAPLRWLLPGVFTLSVGKVLVSEILARENSRATMWVAVVAALVNIIGNLALIPYMGTSGAALASSISYTLVSIMVIWIFVRETGVPATMLIPQWSDLQAYSTLWRRFRKGSVEKDEA